jgi:hypothetical protein
VSFLCSNEQTLVSSPTTGQPLFIQQHQFCQNHQTITHISLQIVWSLLNKCMNKHEQQYQIQRQETTDTITADKWIASSGLDINIFSSTHIRLLQAQQQASTIPTSTPAPAGIPKPAMPMTQAGQAAHCTCRAFRVLMVLAALWRLARVSPPQGSVNVSSCVP